VTTRQQQDNDDDKYNDNDDNHHAHAELSITKWGMDFSAFVGLLRMSL
jgi:hypothetical protein